MPRTSSLCSSLLGLTLLLTRACAFYSPTSFNVGVRNRLGRPCPQRQQGLGKLATTPIDKLINGLSDMMIGLPPKDDDVDEAEMQQGLVEEPQDMNSFRKSLIKQTRKDSLKKQQDFTGYDMYDLIVDKFHVPYDVQINKTVFAGKPVLCLNVMWKYLGQSSFPLSEQEYLEHLQALADLLKDWDRVDHFKGVLAETKKKPNPYFGYAVALPLDLAPDTLAGYFDESYF